MNITKYVGITLLFLYQLDNHETNVVLQSFIINVKNLKELNKEANQIGIRVSKKFREGQCKYLGINDVFEVNGPLKTGAILGRSTLSSYKDIDSARRLLLPKSEYWINIDNKKNVQQFIAEAVFLLPSPIKYSDRRSIICNVLIESSNDSIFKNTVIVGKSQELKNKLFKVLLQYEPTLMNKLHFVGIANIKSVYDKVGVGKCFEALFKKERNVVSVNKLVFPIKKFNTFKF